MANLLILVILAFMAAPILAAPFSNDTAGSPPAPFSNNTVGSFLSGHIIGFQPEPSGRGTVGLIISCSATFIICIWTSVHADIAPPRATWLTRFVYKAAWMFVSAVIPEGLVACAFGQWREARKIRKTWGREVPQNSRKLSMEEAFFVVMGGFTIREESGSTAGGESEGTKSLDTEILTSEGFQYYVMNGQISDNAFEKRHIVDKAKGSDMAKLIACIQVLWLVMQCISRRVCELPLTLLEIHVVIQVGCTMVTYLLWWHKPLDVEQRILLPKPSGQTTVGSLAGGVGALAGEPKKDYDESWPRASDPSRPHYITREGQPKRLATIALAFHDIVRYVNKDYLPYLQALLAVIVGGLHTVAWNTHFPTPIESWMWRVSSIVICIVPFSNAIISSLRRFDKLLVLRTHQMSFEPSGRIRDLPQFVWKVLVRITRKGRREPKWTGKLVHLSMVGIFLALVFLYGAAALYLLVESYISLRSPPDKSFETPNWINYAPHL